MLPHLLAWPLHSPQFWHLHLNCCCGRVAVDTGTVAINVAGRYAAHRSLGWAWSGPGTSIWLRTTATAQCIMLLQCVVGCYRRPETVQDNSVFRSSEQVRALVRLMRVPRRCVGFQRTGRTLAILLQSRDASRKAGL